MDFKFENTTCGNFLYIVKYFIAGMFFVMLSFHKNKLKTSTFIKSVQRNFLGRAKNFGIYITFYAKFKNKC